MKKLFLIIITFFCLSNCSRNKSTFDDKTKFRQFGTLIKIEYFKRIENKAFKYSDSASFVITNKAELGNVISEIKNADNPELWKGAGWNLVKISYKDTVLKLLTNDTKIGSSASGVFYDLPKNNFITKREN